MRAAWERLDPDLGVLLALLLKGTLEGGLDSGRGWKMYSSRTPGLNPTSEFPYCIETSFDPCLVLLLSDAKIAKAVQHDLGV